MAEIFISYRVEDTYTVLVDISTGVSAQLGMALFRRLHEARRRWVSLLNDFTGASLACAIGGTLVGMLGGWVFGLRDREPIGGPLLVASALLGSSIVLYDTGGRFGRMIRYCLYPVPVSGAVAYAAYHLLEVDLYAEDLTSALLDGARLGMVIGLVMGVQIGLGLFLYRRKTWARGDSFGRDRRSP